VGLRGSYGVGLTEGVEPPSRYGRPEGVSPVRKRKWVIVWA